jgi:osmotically-inducible protein OsmY
VVDCVEQIIRLAESPTFQETHESRNALMDQLILARVRFAIDRRFGPKSLQNCFDVHVFNGKVLLTGATTDEQMIVEAVRLLQGVAGVTGVESKVAHIAFAPND